MAARAGLGDGNLLEFRSLTTANVINALLTVHQEDKTKSVKITGHPKTGKMTIDIDGRHGDAGWFSFLDTYLHAGELTPIVEKYTDGSQDTTTVALQAETFFYTCYFGNIAGSTKVLYGVGVLSGPTGDLTTGVDAFEQTPVQITAIAAPASIAVASSVWNSLKVNSTVATTLAAGSYGGYITLTSK